MLEHPFVGNYGNYLYLLAVVPARVGGRHPDPFGF